MQTSFKSNSFVEQIVCSRENNLCMYGDCVTCQIKIPSTEIPKLYPQIDVDEDVSWMKWAKLNGKLDIHRISGSIHDLLLEMDHQWLKFITHSYIKNAQFEYIKTLKESLPVDTVLVHMDFAENYVRFLHLC
jgi:hypothetical protein